MDAKLGLYLAVALTTLALPVRGAEPMVASIGNLTGQVLLVRGADTIPCRQGMHVLTADALRTQADSRVGIIFRDGGRMSLGPNSEARVDKFVYEPAEGRFDKFLRLLRGVAVYVSGKIGQLSPNSVQIETPVGMIGLRGTEVAISLDQP